ncbi:hypothetical protein [Pseudolabrys sp. FHR47]|uniref:hypothetical protein n=1 Tax=Pseudolabrys sp. FHR47 TaxID=2562284 RepID=UPI0010BE5BB2|nr:hypothetical protein [Pseudolabrys sp. FHR47]
MSMRRFPRQAVIAASIFSFVVSFALAAPARADDNGDDRPWDSRFIGNMLEGLGLQPQNKNAIVYQERAPLVIPPSTNLPMPEKSDTTIANNPAWPKDPDVKRKKEAARQARLDAYKSADQKQREEQRVLSPSEMMPGASATNRPPRVANDPNRTAGTWSESGDKLTPSQLGYRGGLFGNMFGGKEEDVARFTGEPPRTALTDPPPGYQTPSPDQPYGSGADRNAAPKATNYLESKGSDNPK